MQSRVGFSGAEFLNIPASCSLITTVLGSNEQAAETEATMGILGRITESPRDARVNESDQGFQHFAVNELV